MKVKIIGKKIEGEVIRVIHTGVNHPSYVIDTEHGGSLIVPIHEAEPISGEFSDELAHQLLFAGLNTMTKKETK